ncbi:BID domain-containing T4SS effector [Bartonella ancashensis]|uniref:protein adenylyltransferase n=1 Tax=Bartonella ancashensis TaxID=1318743 RepID=A0A0M3T2M9_9HYPH|nr:BID domain-containing T4SS effector [Bartonella ancashensis]ALE03015.1 hypothetical protein PU02_0201 [Bartonella ancashensis]ARE31020.1 Bep201 [Bartonella ancashensis]
MIRDSVKSSIPENHYKESVLPIDSSAVKKAGLSPNEFDGFSHSTQQQNNNVVSQKALSLNYFYPNTNILKNKYKIKSSVLLKEKYLHDAKQAATDLRFEPLPKNFDSSYLKYIHKRLFGNAFEWAGYTRDVSFAFADNTVAQMSLMYKRDFSAPFATSEEIHTGLQNLDKEIADKNNLKDLSREEFISYAAPLFARLNYLHPFREGNGHAQRMFFERLAKAAGHNLDFSLATKARMDFSCSQAMKHNNLEPMQHMFEDVSNPHKRLLLREFLDSKEAFRNRNSDDYCIVVAKEGEPIAGIYENSRVQGFTINTSDTLVVCPKRNLPKEYLEKLQPGDYTTFVIEEAPKILIPAKRMKLLTAEKLSQMVSEDLLTKSSRKVIEMLSKTVYGKSNILEEKMDLVEQQPHLGEVIATGIRNDPESISKLSGAECALFGYTFFKSETRQLAEKDIPALCDAIKSHADTIKLLRSEISQSYQAERYREGQPVFEPEKSLRKLLSLPKEQRENLLSLFPELRKEVYYYMKAINNRLSPKDHEAIAENNHAMFAKNTDLPLDKAKEVIDIVKSVKEVYEQARIAQIDQSKSRDLAVVHH